MTVHHVGYAVHDIGKASKAFSELGFVPLGVEFDDVRRGVRILLMKNEATVIELVAPSGSGSPIDKVLEASGPGCYHLCYSVADLEAEKKRLGAARFKLILDTEEAPALGESRVAFMYNVNVGLIELVESGPVAPGR